MRKITIFYDENTIEIEFPTCSLTPEELKEFGLLETVRTFGKIYLKGDK